MFLLDKKNTKVLNNSLTTNWQNMKQKQIKNIALLATVSCLFSCQVITNKTTKKTSSLTPSSIPTEVSKSQCQSQVSHQIEGKSEEHKTSDSLQSNVSVTNNLMQTEVLGELKIDDSDRQIISYLGNPEIQSKNVMWGSDGLYHQTWDYPQQGIKLEMVSETEKGTQQVSSITISEPSQLKTERNIGIGDLYEKVEEVYKQEKDVDNSITCESFVAGSIYEGIIFSFNEGKVSKIFLGSAAE